MESVRASLGDPEPEYVGDDPEYISYLGELRADQDAYLGQSLKSRERTQQAQRIGAVALLATLDDEQVKALSKLLEDSRSDTRALRKVLKERLGNPKKSMGVATRWAMFRRRYLWA